MFKTTLDKSGAKILITGDSISFNRYDFDELRGMEPQNYGIGLGSWSFELRDKIYKADDQFIYGENIDFDCKTEVGINNSSETPHTAMFSNKIKTLYPQKEVSFSLPIKNKEIVLYLQNRIDNFCTFDIEVDGVVVKENVNTKGDINDFAGYSLHILRLSCNAQLAVHTVKFINIVGENPIITVAAVGAIYRNIALSGRGCTCADFFIENFEERIANHNPDLIIFSVSANDRIKIAPEILRINLIKLFSMIFQRFSNCKLLVLLPPNSHNPQNSDVDISPYSSLTTAEVYNRTVEAVCRELGKEKYDGYALPRNISDNISCFRISSLFDDSKVNEWRYDNIHLNQNGNKILLEAISEIVGLS